MGTAGLRRKTRVFQQPHYLACFVQAVCDTLRLPKGSTFVLGGDGRYFNREAIPVIAEVLAGNGVRHIIIGQNGLLSTPAASHLIRKRHADCGFMLTASHNPGGPDGDFGIKFNLASGGQASPAITDGVFDASRRLTGYQVSDIGPLALESLTRTVSGGLEVEIVDPVSEYHALMEKLFDFEQIQVWIRNGNRFVFDAFHGITGPYADRIFGHSLGVPTADLLHLQPLPDFGGLHPDPNPVDARHLIDMADRPDSAALLAASDGDGIPGVARSMPTSRALDVVAATQSLPCYETPTGWRFFCNLFEASRIGLCGEESFGTGASHVREKDGLWAVLFWLSLLAIRNESIPNIMSRHWRTFGRHYYRRHDYQIADAGRAENLMESMRSRCATFHGKTISGGRVEIADDFSYRDPVDQTLTSQQGVRIATDNGLRIVFRLSGTGTTGATPRIYLERYEPAGGVLDQDTGNAVAALALAAAELAEIEQHTGLSQPTARV